LTIAAFCSGVNAISLLQICNIEKTLHANREAAFVLDILAEPE
jgi:hypothetical protein